LGVGDRDGVLAVPSDRRPRLVADDHDDPIVQEGQELGPFGVVEGRQRGLGDDEDPAAATEGEDEGEDRLGSGVESPPSLVILGGDGPLGAEAAPRVQKSRRADELDLGG